jgi:hypothetical protein
MPVEMGKWMGRSGAFVRGLSAGYMYFHGGVES